MRESSGVAVIRSHLQTRAYNFFEGFFTLTSMVVFIMGIVSAVGEPPLT